MEDQYLGREVECGDCRAAFVARAEDRPARPADGYRPVRRRSVARDDEDEGDGAAERPRRQRDEDDEYDDRPRRRKRRRYEEDEETARAALLGPGIGLIVIGVLGLVWGLFNFVVVLTHQPPPNQQNDTAYKLGYYGAGIVQPIWAMLSMGGGVAMLCRKGYPMAMTGAITTMVPCSLCCVTVLPLGFGIWALVTLLRPEIKRAFEA